MADVQTTGTGIKCLYCMLLCLDLDVCIFSAKCSEITWILVSLKIAWILHINDVIITYIIKFSHTFCLFSTRLNKYVRRSLYVAR